MGVRCSGCGKENEEGTRFCSYCGSEIREFHGAGLERMPVALLFLLVLVTFGIYAAIWFLKRIEDFNRLKSDIKMSQGVFGFIIAGQVVNILIVVYLAASGSLEPTGSALEPLVANLLLTSDVLTLAVQVAILIQAFKVRRILLDHYSLAAENSFKLSWVWTLVFGIFYLQFRINRLGGKESTI